MADQGRAWDRLLRMFEQFSEPEPLLTALLPALGEALPCDRCFLYLREPTQNRGTITHCWSCEDVRLTGSVLTGLKFQRHRKIH